MLLKIKLQKGDILVLVESQWVTEEEETGEPREQSNMTPPLHQKEQLNQDPGDT